MEPNLELLEHLAPDHILTIPFLEGIRPQLARIGRVASIEIYAQDGRPFERAAAATRQLGSLTGRDGAAEELIGTAQATLERLRQRLVPSSDRPVYVVTFLDPRNIRIYGRGSMFQDVLDQIGIRNGWTGETNDWGFSTVCIDQLADGGPADVRMVYLEPLPEGAAGTLTESPIWNAMPFVRHGRIHRLPAVLMFGALPSALRFARELADALDPDGAAHG